VCKLGDFGLARHVRPLTLLASVRGTLGFKAPEALRELGSDSPAGDVWAVGCTLYLLLTDQMPYPDPEPGRAPVFGPLLPAGRLNVEVDPALDAIVARALAVRPQERYPSAAELLADLETWRPQPAVEEAPPVVEESPAERARRAERLAREGGSLPEAALLLEQACKQAPELLEQYEDQIRLWRRGIVL
jgi:serine/threonine-protein kinase